MWRDFSKTLRELLEIPGYGGAYRPDLHYMRGPGPKWHAKYGSLGSQDFAVRQADRARAPRHRRTPRLSPSFRVVASVSRP